MIRRFLLIPHLKIHNANAMSSPYTIGFPAITAWLGAVHLLQRKLHQNNFSEVKFFGTAISCHEFNLQTYKGYGDYVYSIIGTANPLNKDGSRPAFIEEARCHLEASLLIEYKGLDPDYEEDFKNLINQQLLKMKFAGGDVLSVKPVSTTTAIEDEPSSIKEVLKKLMLGYVIIERRDLMQKSMQEGRNALEAILDHLKIMHRSTKNDKDEVIWTSSKKEAGWLVPIAVGFQGISELGQAKNQRDLDTPHRFAESVITLGEFTMPYRIEKLDDILWQYNVIQNLYLCQTNLNLTK